MPEKRYRLQVESDGKALEFGLEGKTYTATEIGKLRVVKVADEVAYGDNLQYVAELLQSVMKPEGFRVLVVPGGMNMEFFALELPPEAKEQTFTVESLSPEARAELEKFWTGLTGGDHGALAAVKFTPSQGYATGGMVTGPILADLDGGCVVHPMKPKGVLK